MQGLCSTSALLWAPEKAGVRQPLLILLPLFGDSLECRGYIALPPSCDSEIVLVSSIGLSGATLLPKGVFCAPIVTHLAVIGGHPESPFLFSLNFFLLYGPPNQWWGSQVLSQGVLISPHMGPNGEDLVVFWPFSDHPSLAQRLVGVVKGC